MTNGFFIHQVLVKLKLSDIPAPVRVEAIKVMIDKYFKDNIAVQAGYPIEMRCAGPREALFHALIRQNFGCSHLIFEHDHAGVGDFYGPFGVHHIFDTLWDDALVTQPLKIDITFYCEVCNGMATAKTCPHDEKYRINIPVTANVKFYPMARKYQLNSVDQRSSLSCVNFIRVNRSKS